MDDFQSRLEAMIAEANARAESDRGWLAVAERLSWAKAEMPGGADTSSVLQEDLRDMLRALGLSDAARPQSPHEVFRDVERLRGFLAAAGINLTTAGILLRGRLNRPDDAAMFEKAADQVLEALGARR